MSNLPTASFTRLRCAPRRQILALLLFLVLALPTEAQIGLPILRYDVTEIDPSTEVLPDGHWARYVDGLCDRRGSSTLQLDLFEFFDLGINTDFFSRVNASIYVSMFGFLSTMPYPMCDGFCEELIYDALYGFYQFTNDAQLLATLGGDWPAIGLFVSSMGEWPVSRMPSRICASRMQTDNSTGSPVRFRTVVYENRRLIMSGKRMSFTGQVSVFDNGTIIMRYKDVPKDYVERSGLPASVGLVLTKKQRRVVGTPGHMGKPLVSFRFDPVRDSCASASSLPACTALGSSCRWCRATHACANVNVMDDLCPRGFVDGGASGPVMADQSGGASFYDVSITQEACYTEPSLVGYTWTNRPVSPGFPLSLFGRTAEQLSFLQTSVYGFPFTQIDCNPLWGYCVNGNYTNVIADLATALRPTCGALGATVSVRNDSFVRLRPCSRTPQRRGGSGNGRVTPSRNDFVTELMIAPNGTIEILYGCPQVLVPPTDSFDSRMGDERRLDYWTRPTPYAGLIRRGVDDPATILIPPLLISAGTRVRFTPKATCPPCGMRGECDPVTSTCRCDRGYAGATCDTCADGYERDPLQDTCYSCPPCSNQGRCQQSPRENRGWCACPFPFSGRTCERRCEPDELTCNAALCAQSGHGYCECDRCVCTDGYSGSNCYTPPQDPCRRYSLDGCPQCNAVLGGNCSFCFDSTCFAPALSGTASGYACSYAPLPALIQACHTLRQPVLISTDVGQILLAVGTSFLVVLYLIIGAIAAFVVRTARSRNHDVHVAVAAGGVLDYKPVRREREVVQTQLVFQERVAQRPHVLGFVLHQISLKKLYKRQRGIPVGGAAATSEDHPHD